ncbi:MAG: HAMP domain-containing sensor histidine kinase, partial [Bacteroidota bacterium]|nr:HAMP domain-containing sensor histidine kinase [Bacteroidota bacterium]
KVCNINDFVRDLYESYKTSSNIRNNYNVKFVLKDYPKEIDTYTDPKRLKQILDNLISNAIKFTDKGTIEIGYSLKDKNIEFFIKDTGIGIPSDNLNSIFMPFRKVNEKVFSASNIGTGLGLSISKNLIEMLGGKIWLETEENEGSTFSFMLPYTKK